jgi:hypothetical protein
MYELTASYKTYVPTIDTAIVLLRHPVVHAYAIYWYWCLQHEKESLEIPECRHEGAWRPKGNSTQRSPEDFHARYFNPDERNDFKEKEHAHYYSVAANALKTYYGRKLRTYLTEHLYNRTSYVLKDILQAARLPDYDFSAISGLAVNINGQPGIDAAVPKRRGHYPLVLPETLQAASYHVSQLCRHLEAILMVNICVHWSQINIDHETIKKTGA